MKNPLRPFRWMAACAVFLQLACGGPRVVTVADNGKTLELEVGERLRFEFASHPTYAWRMFGADEPFILEDKSSGAVPRPGTATEAWSVFELLATGGGEQHLRFFELPTGTYQPQSSYSSLTFTVKVKGPSREEEILALYRGFVPVGGFGTSRESGRPIRELALFPTDLVAGADGQLYVASEERVWRIDPAAKTGVIWLDRTRSGSPLPEDAVVTALDQRGSADWLLGLRRGNNNVVGWLRAGGGWEELRTWSSPLPIHRVRIAPDGVEWAAVDRVAETPVLSTDDIVEFVHCIHGPCGGRPPDAVEFDGAGRLYLRGRSADSRSDVLAGRDRGNKLLFLADIDTLALARLEPTGGLVPLFRIFNPEDAIRRTDFRPAVHGGEMGGQRWPAQKAAVAQTGDGAYWATSVHTVQNLETYEVHNEGRGLYVHAP